MRRYVFVRVSLKRRDGNARDLSRWGRDERAPRPRAPQRGPRTSFEDVTSLERPIHLGLELPEQVDRDVVVEREDLREEDATDEIGRASCRERVSISVVAVSLKKKKNTPE